MKRIFFLLVILLISVQFCDADAQQRNRFGDRPNKRIEELRKIKLIETLKMDEETTLKFFSRRNKHQEEMRSLGDKGDQLLEQIEDNIKEGNKAELNDLINSYLENEQKINEERDRFIRSLSDLLTQEQLASLLVFERRFMEEIRDIILRERGPRRK